MIKLHSVILLNIYRVIIALCIISGLGACYGVRPTTGGAKTTSSATRKINVKDIALPKGYKIEPVASGLTFPTGIAFDDQGDAYVVESGYSYGETWTQPRLIRLSKNGDHKVIAAGEQNGPWNGLTFHDGNFYIAEGGELEGGKILKVSKAGEIKTLVDGLPSIGDHHTDGPVVIDHYVYFGQGTATNSGVVGEDNAKFGWLKRHPEFHDIPCKDVMLTGKNFESPNPLTEDANDKAKTGAFVPFNTTTTEAQVIHGSLPCSGAIMRLPVEGGALELVAWGFRNPFGLAVHEGKIFVTENGYDERGSRPIWGTGDVLWKIEEGKWYGWPDHSAGMMLNHEEFKVPGKKETDLVLMEHPNKPPKPAAILGVHSSSNGFDFSTSDQFGFKGKAFIAQFGDMAPNVGKVLAPVGYKIVIADPETGTVYDFAVNKGKQNGPSSWLKKGGLERPVAAKFHPVENALYVVDFGVVTIEGKNLISKQNTGVIWKITKQ